MITEPIIYSGDQKNTPPPLPNLDFRSIDGPITHWSQRFPIAMLRVGRILLKNDDEVMNVPAEKISGLMAKHSNEIPEYSGMEIRDHVHLLCGEIRGGGIRVEWTQDSNRPYRSIPHYDFTFSRISRPEDYEKPEMPNKPV
jgi:hypothetical protein